MITFFLGLVLLIAGGHFYGKLCEKVMKPTDRKTPALEKYDGVDYVPMKKSKNALVELLNIAGTGPILGPIQGALFGPIAFITIPIGCVIGGAVHDYMSGMISLRNDGEQMPLLVRKFLGKHGYRVYNVFVYLMLLLLSVVFIYTPGDIFVTHVLDQKSSLSNPVIWIVYAVIFAYYIIATLLPIDKIIGKVYPILGALLILSAVGVFFGMFIKGYHLDEIWESASFVNPYGEKFIPIFFVTVACGIVSGFHSTQATIVSRTVTDEREGRMTFYNMMIAEGFIAMIWAAAAMGAVNAGLVTNDMLHNSPTDVVGVIAKNLLGSVGGMIAVFGIIVFPITSGDTSLRSLRIMVCDAFHINVKNKKIALPVALLIFALVAAILIYAKSDAEGFNKLWRYFSWMNECTAVAAFSLATIYMIKNRLPYIMTLAPGAFYMYVVISFILSAKIGFRLPSAPSYIGAAILTLVYVCLLVFYSKKQTAVPGSSLSQKKSGR